MILTPPPLFTETATHTPSVGAPRDMPGCVLQGVNSTEPREDGSMSYRVVSNVVLYVPAEHAEPIAASDTVAIRGRDYMVEGTPLAERSAFTGTQSMVAVALRRITG